MPHPDNSDADFKNHELKRFFYQNQYDEKYNFRACDCGIDYDSEGNTYTHFTFYD